MITATRRRILLAEDEANVRKVIAAHLRRAGFEVVEATNKHSAKEEFAKAAFDLVLTDLKMPDSEWDGLDVLQFVTDHSLKQGVKVPVLILTAYGTGEKAIEAISRGAYNLISKPCDLRELTTQVENALRETESANVDAQTHPAEDGRFGIIGRTPAMIRIFDTIATVGSSPSTVLITGDSGTGKELVARALHMHSSRAQKPFVTINCSAIPEHLLESELFGYEKGAFTGATNFKPGRFEHAHEGTLFLDEIGDMKPSLQVKLLRCLQEQEFERVGGLRPIKVDVRLVAATNRDLQAEVKAGSFREDLFYRLKVVPIHLPPLRDRKDDIPLLVEHFLLKYNARLGRKVSGVDKTVLELLRRYSWPGNIRELENVMERMLLFSDSTRLSVRDIPEDLLGVFRDGDSKPPADALLEDSKKAREYIPLRADEGNGGAPAIRLPTSLKDMVRETTSVLERGVITQTLEESDWNVTRSAERLGLSRKGLQVKMKELDIRKPGG